MSAAWHRLRRLSVRLLLSVAGTLLLVVGILTALTATPSGSRWLLQQAIGQLPASLTIERVDGTLLHGMNLAGIDYRDRETELEIERLELAWRPTALLRGQLRLTRVDVRGVRYRETRPASESTNFSLPEHIPLPLAIAIDEAHIEALQAQIGTDTYVIDNLWLSAHAGSIRGLVVDRFDIRSGDSRAELSGHAGLQQPYPLHARLHWRTRLEDEAEAVGEATIEGNLKRIQVDHRLRQPFEVGTRGSIRMAAGTAVMDLSGQWKRARWPLSGKTGYLSPQGDYRLQGTVDDWDATLAGTLTGADIPPMEIRARGQGNRRQVDFRSLLVRTLNGELSASGTLGWEPSFKVDLDVRAKDIDPGARWSAWPGRLAFRTRLRLQQDGTISLSLRDIDLSGRLRERPVAARGDLELGDDRLAARELVIASGSNRLSLTGELNKGSALEYRLDAREPATLLPGLSGHFQANGRLQGTLTRPWGTLTLNAGELAWQDTRIRTLKAKATLDPWRPRRSLATIDARGLEVDNQTIEHLRLEAKGWLQEHRISVRLGAPDGSAQLELRGAYRAHRWDAKLKLATLESRTLGTWRLRQPVPLTISAERVQPLRACWFSGKRELCLGGHRNQAEIRLSIAGQAPEGELQGEVRISPPGTTGAKLAGSIELDIPRLAAIAPQLPELQLVAGSARLQARLAGTTDHPLINGRADVEGGTVRVPQLGVEVKEFVLQGRAEGRQLRVEGSARSGPGAIRLAGELALAPRRGWPFRLTLTGERVAVARLPDVEIDASPELAIQGSLKRVEVSGSVLIPHARVEIRKLPAGVVRLSPDQVIVGQAQARAAKRKGRIPLVVDVSLALGKDVHFEGLGLDTDLAGSLRLRSQDTHRLAGFGVLRLINGRYEGYGQRLRIRQGRLVFAGPLDDPALDVRATRTIGDVVAGLQLVGKASAPRITLFSDPAMPDAEILSWLITGKPLDEQGGGSDSQALAAAAASLGANNPVAQEISRALGIEVGVQSGTAEEDTTLRVGKQLSPRLKLNYLYGLFTENGAVQLIYRLSRHLSLTGQSGREQSIDLTLGIDRP
ncbi:MAG TPA: hypothetical protein ENK05_12775 [Gammaproteobacteria bacterium]|nr:hypothetical protein [Gammaproteobacteria bacterium]